MARTKKSLQNATTSSSGMSVERLEIAKRGEEILNQHDDKIKVPPFIDDNEEARELFIYLADKLVILNLYSELDNFALGNYCLMFIKYLNIVKQLEEHGTFTEQKDESGNIIKVEESAYSKTARAYLRELQALEKHYPFTPLTRLNFRDVIGEKEKSLADILEDEDEEDDE